MLAGFRPSWPARLAALVCLAAAAAPAVGYGPAGHAIAGLAAEPLLCRSARAALTELAGDADLARIGRWADTIRSDPRFEHTAPWHYMNVPDGGSIAAYESPPEGDVLRAIERFRARLADRSLAREARLEALGFLVHFVVDIHQPLHVGREGDRGGNTIDVVVDGETTNLHRFWDSGALDLENGGSAGYAERLTPLAQRLHEQFDPASAARWAEESLMLRPWVYSFDPDGNELSADYVERAETLTRMRLAQAAARLAATLNGIYCQ